jgi:hypothetical protein
VKIRIIRQPGGIVDGSFLDAYRVGQVYDVPMSIGTYLVAEGYAIVELRSDGRAGESERRSDG